jgi:hypothetical protein
MDGVAPMAIILTIKTKDEEVEDLMEFLRSRFPEAEAADHIEIMNRAEKWLRTVDEYMYVVNLDRGDELSLDFVRTEPIFSPHPDTPA